MQPGAKRHTFREVAAAWARAWAGDQWRVQLKSFSAWLYSAFWLGSFETDGRTTGFAGVGESSWDHFSRKTLARMVPKGEPWVPTEIRSADPDFPTFPWTVLADLHPDDYPEAWRIRCIDCLTISEKDFLGWVLASGLSMGDLGPVEHAAKHVFRQEHERRWTLAFDGDEVILSLRKPLIGMKYICVLLGQPRHDFSAQELQGMLAAESETDDTAIRRRLSRNQREAEGFSGDGSGFDGDYSDPQAIDEYRAQLQSNKTKRAEAEAAEDADRVRELDREYKVLKQEINRTVGRWGRRDKVPADLEKARKRIANAIVRAIRQIEQNHPGLAAHLNRSLKPGGVLGYYPAKELHWITSSCE